MWYFLSLKGNYKWNLISIAATRYNIVDFSKSVWAKWFYINRKYRQISWEKMKRGEFFNHLSYLLYFQLWSFALNALLKLGKTKWDDEVIYLISQWGNE